SESVVKLSTTLPNCAGTIDSPIDLSLRWLGANPNGTIEDETQPVLLGTLDPPFAQVPEVCPQTLGVIAGGYRITQFNSPASVRIGETYLPSLNWIVTETSPDVAGRAFIFTHEGTGEQYLCGAIDNAVQTWRLGEYRYFDRCPMTFPPEASPGVYMVSIGLVNAAGEWMPATDAAGEPLPDNAVRVGTITLEASGASQ